MLCKEKDKKKCMFFFCLNAHVKFHLIASFLNYVDLIKEYAISKFLTVYNDETYLTFFYLFFSLFL